jgi:hypothetical protein
LLDRLRPILQPLAAGRRFTPRIFGAGCVDVALRARRTIVSLLRAIDARLGLRTFGALLDLRTFGALLDLRALGAFAALGGSGAFGTCRRGPFGACRSGSLAAGILARLLLFRAGLLAIGVASRAVRKRGSRGNAGHQESDQELTHDSDLSSSLHAF